MAAFPRIHFQNGLFFVEKKKTMFFCGTGAFSKRSTSDSIFDSIRFRAHGSRKRDEIDRQFGRQTFGRHYIWPTDIWPTDIWPTDIWADRHLTDRHLADRHFTDGTFHQQDIRPTWHFTDMTFGRRQDISLSGLLVWSLRTPWWFVKKWDNKTASPCLLYTVYRNITITK